MFSFDDVILVDIINILVKVYFLHFLLLMLNIYVSVDEADAFVFVVFAIVVVVIVRNVLG